MTLSAALMMLCQLLPRFRERFLLLGDVLPENVWHIHRGVMPDFSSDAIEERFVFGSHRISRGLPNGPVCRIAEQAFQGGDVRCPALGVERSRPKLQEAVFIAPENRPYV